MSNNIFYADNSIKMQENVQCNVDFTKYSSKPTGSQCGNVNNSLNNSTTTISITDLANILGAGGSFTPAAIAGKRANENWQSQQLFALDFDNKESIFTIQDALARCEKYNIDPCFFYYSFSSTPEHPKFRLVFATTSKITDIRVRNLILFSLMKIFPESDMACKDPARLFYGGKSGSVIKNPAGTLHPMLAIDAVVAYIKDNDTQGNYNRDIKAFCQTIALNMINNIPDIRYINDDTEIDENATNSIIYNSIDIVAISSKTLINFSTDYNAVKKATIASVGKKKDYKHAINSNKVDYKGQEEIRDFDFKALHEGCQLWREFVDGTTKISHMAIFNMATNMWRVRGSESKMLKALDSELYNNSKYNNKVNTIIYCAKQGYPAHSCNKDFCPYMNNCKNTGINMLEIKEKKMDIVKIEEQKYITLEEVQENMNKEVVLDGKIHIYPIQTGAGKTTGAINKFDSNNDYTTVFAFPTHTVKDEKILEFEAAGKTILSTIKRPNIPNLKVRAKVEMLERLGLGKKANAEVHAYIAKLKSRTSYEKQAETQEERDIIAWEDNNRMCAGNVNLITTHANIALKCDKMSTQNIANSKIKQDLIIFDEDPINYFITNETINISDFENILEYLVDDEPTHAMINEIIKNGTHPLAANQVFTLKNKIFNTDNIATAVAKAIGNGKEITGKMGTFFECQNYMQEMYNTVDEDNDLSEVKATGRLVYSSIKDLPAGKTIIIYSATASAEIYKMLYKDRVVVHDCGIAKEVGNVFLNNFGPKNRQCGFGKLYVRNNLEAIIGQVRKTNVKNVITFKEFKDDFEKAGFNVPATFGNTTGINSISGQDLAVVGTYNVKFSKYISLAFALGIMDVFDASILTLRKVKYNNFYFSLNSVKDDARLEAIQLWMINSELEQAAGRARTLRNKCTVWLFSNFPVKDCIPININKIEDIGKFKEEHYIKNAELIENLVNPIIDKIEDLI